MWNGTGKGRRRGGDGGGRLKKRRRCRQCKHRPGRPGLPWQQRGPVVGHALRLGFSDGGQRAVPAPAGRDAPAQLAQRDHAGRDQFVRGGVIEPARDQVAGQRGFGGKPLQPAQQRQLAFAQTLAARGQSVCRPGIFVELEHFGLAKAVQAALGCEVFQGRAVSTRRSRRSRQARMQAQADQTPGAFPAAPGHRAHRICRLLVGSPGLVAMLDAEVAPGAVCDVQPFGDGAQVREVVRAQAAYKNGERVHGRVLVLVRSSYGESADPVPGAARHGDFSGNQNGAGGVFMEAVMWRMHCGV